MKNTDIIKDKLNILDVVSSYVTLEKAGKTYKGKSPFTNEKTPSFFVSPEKGFFYCFSSGKGGDMFTFIQEIERVEFKEALSILAEKAGVDLGTYSLEDHASNNQRYQLLDTITKWYEVNLRKNTEVVEYLLDRGLKKETIISFRLGFAPEAWRECYGYLKHKKYSDEDIEAVGLIIQKEGGNYYDRFRSRIMFPLFDARGRVVGFSGRIFNESEENKGAKYINSPEGPLFDKSKVLYGYHIAKSEIAKKGSCILVEGQFDVLMAHQAGYKNTVAISGTGLTDSHIAMIKRFTDTILLALDADNAGVKATKRSVMAAYRHGMKVKIIMMPEGMDPADTISRSVEQWDLCVKDAEEYIDYRLKLMTKQKDLSFGQKQTLVSQEIFPFIYEIKSAMVQDKFLQKISLFLGVSIESVRSDFGQFIPEQTQSVYTKEAQETKIPASETVLPQEEILYLYTYLLDKGITKQLKDLDRIKELYTEVHLTDIDTDCNGLDETVKNMKLFVYEERYGEEVESFFERKIKTQIIEAYVHKLKGENNELIKQSRLAENSKDKEEARSISQKIHKNQLLIEQLNSESDI